MNQKIISTQQQRNIVIVIFSSILMVTLVMLWSYWNIQQDDSYIFYSYANNIVNDNGYVFNTGERINATTSPFYTLLLSLFAWIFQYFSWITLPVIGHCIGAISLLVTSVLLLKCFNKEEYSVFPYVLPLVFLASPLLANAVGMETFLAMMLAVSSLYLWNRGNLLAASLVCSLAVLTRPDMALLAVILPTYDFIRNRRLPSIAMVLLICLPIVIWFSFSFMYFGDLLPTTLSAKLGQTESGRWGTGLIFLKGLVSKANWNGKMFMYPALIMVLLGIGVFVAKIRQWKILQHPVLHVILLWNLAYLIAYGFILNPPGYPWYYTPLSIGMAIIVTLAIQAFYQFLSEKNIVSDKIILAAIFSLLLVISITLPLKKLSGNVTDKYEIYKLAAEWLNANVEKGSSVGTNEIGILRYYYTNGPIIDALGLVTPEVAEHVKERDYSWYVHQYKPDYLMFDHPHRPVFEAMVETDWFQKEYSVQTKINTSRKSIAIYGRQD
ncbi:MAG: hypothetical protein V3V18_13660 [Methylococcales bacterium]